MVLLIGRAALPLTLAASLLACAGVQKAEPGPDIEALLADPDARVMFVGAHPDDETLASPLLARACVGLERPCLLFIFNHGDGGECLLPEGCFPDLASVRGAEVKRVARAYGAELEHHRFWNCPLPWSSFPPREEIRKRWERQGDPSGLVARAVRRFRPTILLTFDPDRGFTGHPEHQLASRLAAEGAIRAASDEIVLGSRTPYRIPNLFHVINYFWVTRMMGTADPATPTEAFDTHVPCGRPGRLCLDVALDITRFHRTQKRDMGLVRALRPQFAHVFLRRFDPFAESAAQGAEPVAQH